MTDLYKYLGVTVKKPKKKSISATGVIQDDNVQADNELDTVEAYQIRHRNSLSTMNFNIGDKVGNIAVLDGVDGLTLTGGSLNSFTTGSNVDATQIQISGPIKTINVGGSLHGTSSVAAAGTEGTLGTLTTKHALFANVNATVSIGSIIVGTDLWLGQYLDAK